MQEAIIGYSGFVGGNLNAQHAFSHQYRSTNIADIRGQHFDTVVCAGVQPKKWWANQNPQEDWAGIQSLIDHLETITTDRFILISTIDVYPQPDKPLDEAFAPDPEGAPAYGGNRRRLEQWVEGRFQNHHIVRLPGLFGMGLKKNIIYDLMQDNMLEVIHPETTVQYYDLATLWEDIERVVERDIRIINLFPQALKTQDIIDRFFPGKVVGAQANPPVYYDLHTQHASLFPGAPDGYRMGQEEVFERLGTFVQSVQS